MTSPFPPRHVVPNNIARLSPNRVSTFLTETVAQDHARATAQLAELEAKVLQTRALIQYLENVAVGAGIDLSTPSSEDTTNAG